VVYREYQLKYKNVSSMRGVKLLHSQSRRGIYVDSVITSGIASLYILTTKLDKASMKLKLSQKVAYVHSLCPRQLRPTVLREFIFEDAENILTSLPHSSLASSVKSSS
jgi:hypothetical protein